MQELFPSKSTFIALMPILTMQASKLINFIMGILPGWWLGQADGRFPDPYVSSKRWEKELRDVGFDVDATVYDGFMNNYIVARPSLPVKYVHDDTSLPEVPDIVSFTLLRPFD